MHQHGEQSQPVAGQHIGEDPIADQRHLLRGQLQLPAQQVALIGDRVFTDVLAGNRLGLFTVLVHPIGASGQASNHDRLQRSERTLARWCGARVDSALPQ